MDGFNPDAKTPEEYQNGTPRWRTDLYANSGTLMTHDESIALIKSLGAKFTPELKAAGSADAVRRRLHPGEIRFANAGRLQEGRHSAGDVFAQSFNLADMLYWVKTEPEFAKQAVYLEERYEKQGLDPNKPETWKPSMAELKAQGVAILGPPIWTMLTLNDKKRDRPVRIRQGREGRRPRPDRLVAGARRPAAQGRRLLSQVDQGRRSIATAIR